MIRKDALENYYTHSASLSSVNRQLCFAGIAVVWIFVVDGGSGLSTFPDELMFPLGCFIVGLSFDLAQYVVAALVWGFLHRLKEYQNVAEEEEIYAPRYINWPAIFFFWGKVIATATGYVSLLTLFHS